KWLGCSREERPSPLLFLFVVVRWSLLARCLTVLQHGGKIRGLELGLGPMRYDFLVETYDTERIKVVSVWSEFHDEDLPFRPRHGDPRGRSVRDQMVHQCVSENLWFKGMLGIDVNAPPLPKEETRLEFIKRYAEDSGKRLAVLQSKPEAWWEEETAFFDVK